MIILPFFFLPLFQAPRMNIVVTVRGKKYPIEAATVKEVQQEIKQKAGLDPDQQVRGCSSLNLIS